MKYPKTKPLINKEQLDKRIKEIGAEITRDYQGESVVLVCILKGSFMFLADLAREIKVPTEIEFMGVASYQGTESTGHVRITHDLTADISGKNVILVEDIVDTGITIDFLVDTFKVREPKSLKICTLLSKPEAHIMHHKLDYVGFTISKEFVIGYGLDLDGFCRELPEVMQVTSLD